MALTTRSTSVTGGTTAGRDLTYAEVDANWDYVTLASSQRFTPSGTGAVSTDLQTKARQTKSVFDWLTAAQIADVIANTASVDVTTAVQAAMDYATANHLHLEWPTGTYLISSALTIVNVSRWSFDLQNSTIQQATDNTPIFKFNFTTNAQEINTFRIENGHFKWSSNQASANTSAVAIAFTTTTDNSLGVYNGVFRNLRFINGYQGLAITNTTNILTVWGNTFQRLRYESTMTGSAIALRYSNSGGMPNNHFDGIYVDATGMTKNVLIDLSQCHMPNLDNLEFNNVTDSRALLLATCFGAHVGTIRVETATYTTSFRSLVETSESRGTTIDNIEAQTVTFNPGIGNVSVIFRDTSASKMLNTQIRCITTRSCTVSSGNTYLMQSANAHVTLGDFDLSANTGTIVPVYPSDNSLYNCRVTLSLGETAADSGNLDTTLYVKDNTNGTSPETVIYNTAITADRAVTLPTTNIYPGLEYRVVRTANATGAFNVNVKDGVTTLKAMATAGSYCRVQLNGATWRLVEYGTL